MAWFRCMGNGGSPTPDPKYKDISYLKWQLTQTRSDTPAGGYMQITEFYLYLNDEKYEWDSNVSITSNMAGNTGQEVDKIIDSNLNTKYCTQSWGYVKNNECNIIINLGEIIRIDGTTTYSFVTGGDEYSRDPVSWKLYCSTDGINWVLLDERIESNVPISRITETNKYDLERIVKPFTILKGQEYPDSIYGNNGQIYLKYGLVGSLLHFDDSVTKDENGNTWSTYGSSATLSTEQSKFGGKSLYLNGSDYLQSNISDDFNFGSNDFTITCWIYPTTRTRMAVFAMSADLRIGTDIFFGQNSANMWMSSSGSSWNILQSDTSGANTGQGTIPLNANEWTHLAYVRNGANIRMYVNGQVARDVTLSDINTKVYYSGNNGFRIGSWGNDQYRFAGYIDEFLVCNGVALWTDTFTPPTEPFTLNDFNLIQNTYAKVNNNWQNLIGTDVRNIMNVQNIIIQHKNYAKFNGTEGIKLPFTLNSDYKVTVDFYQTEYTSAENIIGNDVSTSYSHLTPYSGGYWASLGQSENLIPNLTWSSGEHIWITNNGNNKNEFDGVEVQDYTPTTASGAHYTIGIRSSSSIIRSYVKYYKIESISTGDVICELYPCLYDNVTPCLYDTVNKRFYYAEGLTVMDTIPSSN